MITDCVSAVSYDDTTAEYFCQYNSPPSLYTTISPDDAPVSSSVVKPPLSFRVRQCVVVKSVLSLWCLQLALKHLHFVFWFYYHTWATTSASDHTYCHLWFTWKLGRNTPHQYRQDYFLLVKVSLRLETLLTFCRLQFFIVNIYICSDIWFESFWFSHKWCDTCRFYDTTDALHNWTHWW